MKKKIRIIRCCQTEDMCPATTCIRAATEGKVAFEEIGECKIVGIIKWVRTNQLKHPDKRKFRTESIFFFFPKVYYFDNCGKYLLQLSKLITTVVKINYDNCLKRECSRSLKKMIGSIKKN